MDIDTTGFELGMPSTIEMLQHQSHMLIAENDQLRYELTQAKANIRKLVHINQDMQSQLSAESLRANGEHVRMVQILNRLRCIHGIDASAWFAD
ncbi:hypothetical protein D3C77_214470 [compost metagenome]